MRFSGLTTQYAPRLNQGPSAAKKHDSGWVIAWIFLDSGFFFSSLRMVYFTTFVHNSPRLPLYKYQGETGLIQFVTMIVMSLYECGNTRESLQDRHLR